MVKKNRRKKKKKIETSKVAMFFIFLNCSIIEIYSMVAMWYFADLSPLYSLIGAVLGESIAYISYCAKAKKEMITAVLEIIDELCTDEDNGKMIAGRMKEQVGSGRVMGRIVDGILVVKRKA